VLDDIDEDEDEGQPAAALPSSDCARDEVSALSQLRLHSDGVGFSAKAHGSA